MSFALYSLTANLSADSTHIGCSHYGILYSFPLHLMHASQSWLHASIRYSLLSAVCLIRLPEPFPSYSLNGGKLLPYRATWSWRSIELKRWLSAFIFVAQTDDFLDNAGCSYFSWDLSLTCRRRNTIEAFTFLSLWVATNYSLLSLPKHVSRSPNSFLKLLDAMWIVFGNPQYLPQQPVSYGCSYSSREIESSGSWC